MFILLLVRLSFSIDGGWRGGEKGLGSVGSQQETVSYLTFRCTQSLLLVLGRGFQEGGPFATVLTGSCN